jgi:signal transduction histidine kinase
VSPSRRADADAAAGERFISSLAHELRTPLAVVVGYAELLRHREDEAVRKEASERILEAADRLSHALDDLLVVYAIDSGYLVVDVQPLDLERAVRQALRLLGGKARGDSIALRAPDAWPRVYADEEHLGRVLTDLLRNAWRLTPVGSQAQAELAVTADGASVAISVSDRGPGLSPEQLATLFDRPPSRDAAAGGTGLELYKARRLVELQGGAITASSREGAGSTVTITLPIAGEDTP